MKRLALIGYGYWGPKLARVASGLDEARLTAICDRDADRRRQAAEHHPEVDLAEHPAEVFSRPGIDGVMIATPVATHAALVRAALEAGKHVMVEKPFVDDSARARELLDLAGRLGLTVMVGHTFLYSAPVRALRAALEAGEVGRVRYIHSQRLNLGLVRPDVNVIWDLAAHDVSILLYALGERPSALQAEGAAFLRADLDEVAFIGLRFPSGIVARVDVSWLAPLKVRLLVVSGERGMIAYDDTAPQPVRVFDRGARRREAGGIEYWDRGERSPELVMTEPLLVQCREFVARMSGGGRPEPPGFDLDVVRALELADRSLRRGGIWLEWEPSGMIGAAGGGAT